MCHLNWSILVVRVAQLKISIEEAGLHRLASRALPDESRGSNFCICPFMYIMYMCVLCCSCCGQRPITTRGEKGVQTKGIG